MPSLKSSLAKPDPSRYTPIRVNPVGPVRGPNEPISAPIHAPSLPVHLMPSPVRITGLPIISTNVDGITRQFYTNNNLPQRRLILPAQ